MKHIRLIIITGFSNLLFLVFIFTLLNSCNRYNHSDISQKLDSIYLKEISYANSNFIKLLALYGDVHRDKYNKVIELEKLFQSIHLSLDKNDHEINSNLKDISELLREDLSLFLVFKNLETFITWDFNDFNKRELRMFTYELHLKLLSVLYFSLFLDDFKFSNVEVMVIPEKTRIKSGEDFKAKIKLQVVDTNSILDIFLNNEQIEIINGVGYLRIKSNELGVFRDTGRVLVINPNTGIIELPFYVEYEVY